MKHYLYEVDCDGCHVHEFPFMPKSMAEKVVKALNNCGGKYSSGKHSISKTTIVIKGRFGNDVRKKVI